jgi:uncharacterized Zn finger protein (UPF0148 family)
VIGEHCCEMCGKPGVEYTRGYGFMCPRCMAERDKEQQEQEEPED